MIYFAIRDKQTEEWVVSTLGDGVTVSKVYGAFAKHKLPFETSLHNLLTALYMEGEKMMEMFEVVELREVEPSKPCEFCPIVKERLADIESVLLDKHQDGPAGIVVLCPVCGRSLDRNDYIQG